MCKTLAQRLGSWGAEMLAKSCSATAGGLSSVFSRTSVNFASPR